MSVLQDLPFVLTEELQLLAGSCSDETEAEPSQHPEQNRPEADQGPSPFPEPRQPLLRRRGIRHCLVADCATTFNGCFPMVGHVILAHCPEGSTGQTS